MSDLIFRTLSEHSEALRKKEYSARELTHAYLSRIEESNAELGAFLTVLADSALQEADAVDKRRQSGEALSPLAGIPMALKDNICTKNIPTTCGSRMLEGYRPPYDATVTERLRQAGTVLLGKTNMDEFGMGSTTEHSAFKITKNPLDPSLVPGGSSGGSAAAVAAYQVPLALGSDTGGSIRQPAAFCGLCGLRPTYGAVSRYGLVVYASSFDQIGPLTHTVRDCAMATEAILGRDPRDATSKDHPTPYFTKDLDGGVQGMRIGLLSTPYVDSAFADVRRALGEAARTLSSLGAAVEEMSLPSFRFATAAYGVMASAEASSNLARFDGVRYGKRGTDCEDTEALFCRSRSEGLGAEVKRRILLGTYVLSEGYYDAYYKKARAARSLLCKEALGALCRYDLLLLPTAPTPPYSLGTKKDDPVLRLSEDLFCLLAPLCGLPALALPFEKTEKGLPLSVQLVGRPFDEATLLRAGYALESAASSSERRPS